MECIQKSDGMVFLVEREPLLAKAGFYVSHSGQLVIDEGVDWLNETKLPAADLPPDVHAIIREGRARAVNIKHPAAAKLLEKPWNLRDDKLRVHILAMGDVGATLLLGLVLLGNDRIASIGIHDVREHVVRRYEYEMNQIAWPFEYDALVPVSAVSQEALFDCDVFIFCASRTVPPVNSAVEDVRMAQLQGNVAILKTYARQARNACFQGLFAIVSDPVDVLCQYAFLESNKNEDGHLDFRGLLPEQIRGYGLGVMNARAAYYAKQDERFSSFLSQGRSFGPHGKELVIANSISQYDETLSHELTLLAVQANLRMREAGFKPYIAPALSSGALSLLKTFRREWHYSAVFMGGVYFGCKNRQTALGIQSEALPLPQTLHERLRHAHTVLWEQGDCWRHQ